MTNLEPSYIINPSTEITAAATEAETVMLAESEAADSKPAEIIMSESKRLISTEDLWRIVDNLHDEIMVYDDDYRMVYINKAAWRHYGKSPETLLGESFERLDETYWGNSTLPDVYRTHKTVAKRQITNLGLDIVTISVPIFDDEGNLKYVAMNVNDIYNYIQDGEVESEFLRIMQSNDTDRMDDSIIYSGHKMKEVVDMLYKLRNVKTPCLILGETGTGKSHLARYVHNQSSRKDKPFVVVNCACMNPNLIESELFGYKKGAFSGASTAGKKGIVEIADGGTLFLDEISEIPIDLQGKLLQFIQEQEFMPLGSEEIKRVDVKIIAATNRNMKQMVEAGTLREDLYYRLNTFEVVMPPLRERRGDIPLLVEHFCKVFGDQYFKKVHFSDEAMDVLERYKWPGNVRELSHIVEKCVVLSSDSEVTVADLPKVLFDLTADGRHELVSESARGVQSLDEAIEAVEREMIVRAYEEYKSSVKVAEALGLSQSRAYRLIKKYCL